jgi:hypothetical protein
VANTRTEIQELKMRAGLRPYQMRLKDLESFGAEYRASCPWHEAGGKHSPSLAVFKSKDDGLWMFKCMAGSKCEKPASEIGAWLGAPRIVSDYSNTAKHGMLPTLKKCASAKRDIEGITRYTTHGRTWLCVAQTQIALVGIHMAAQILQSLCATVGWNHSRTSPTTWARQNLKERLLDVGEMLARTRKKIAPGKHPRSRDWKNGFTSSIKS